MVQAPWWAEGPHELGVFPDDGEDVSGEMGDNIYRLRNMEPWEDGYRRSISTYLLIAVMVVVVLGVLGFWILRRR